MHISCQPRITSVLQELELPEWNEDNENVDRIFLSLLTSRRKSSSVSFIHNVRPCLYLLYQTSPHLGQRIHDDKTSRMLVNDTMYVYILMQRRGRLDGSVLLTGWI